MRKTNTIICFTASFPYGKKETYFETELAYLSKNFDQVIIIPQYNPSGSSKQRTVPENVTVYPPSTPQGLLRVWKGVFNTAPVWFFIADLFKQKAFLHKGRLLKWVNAMLVFRSSYESTKAILSNYPDALLYTYWAEAPLFITAAVRDYRKIVRMHGVDFYTNRNYGYLPLRKEIYDAAQLLLPISKDITGRLHKQYHIPDEKIFLNYLGTYNPFDRIDSRTYSESEPMVLLSCSNLVLLKRVHLIIEALKNTPGDKTVIWHHFGDGPESEKLKSAALALPSNIKVIWHGRVDPATLLTFYNENRITWFLNVSQYEGLPVSIMEAFSSAIPVIATDVGGTSEIVNSTNGTLLDRDFTTSQLLYNIFHITPEQYAEKSKAAYETWQQKFNASINYKQLIDRIKQL